MAYVPQTAPGLGVPVGDLVRELSRVRGSDPARVAEIAGSLDLSLEELARRPFRALSGGTKQKLLIALALAAAPSLLILDEPTGSLDAQSRQRFLELCDRLPQGATLLLCSHHFEEVRQLVGHVLLLEEGRLVYDGASSAFLDASTTGVVEVRVEGEAAEGWLAQHGFRRGGGGWWTRSTGRAEKSELVIKLANELGSALRDVNARDLERIEMRRGDGDGPG
jgi:ABC-type multidrug transport system ATPase subunit